MKYRSLSVRRREAPAPAEPLWPDLAENWHDSSFALQQGLEVREITAREWRQLLAEPVSPMISAEETAKRSTSVPQAASDFEQ